MSKKVFKNYYLIGAVVLTILVAFCFRDIIYADQIPNEEYIVKKEEFAKLLNDTYAKIPVLMSVLNRIAKESGLSNTIDIKELQKIFPPQEYGEFFAGWKPNTFAWVSIGSMIVLLIIGLLILNK